MTGFRPFAAPAKLNLMLRVVGRRSDGYHRLQTIMRFIDYGDVIGVRVRDDGVIARANDVPGVEEASDLTLKAARLLQAETGTRFGADLANEKRIPLGGGLGGGSSDAATTLLALNALWQLDLPRSRLMGLALELGADVPLFVLGENALAEGIGERLTPLAVPDEWYVVLCPPVTVATPAVFAAPELKRDSKEIRIQSFSVDLAGNDLEPVVCRAYPEVARHLQWLRQYAVAGVTGSGACVFAGFGSRAAAVTVLARLPESMKGFVARGLERHPLRDLAR
jgi:4-diphosphocytidyl-2-C-methyl-D-erythritol kinase